MLTSNLKQTEYLERKLRSNHNWLKIGKQKQIQANAHALDHGPNQTQVSDFISSA